MASSQHRCVFVGNIPYDATEEQLIQICEEVGPVVSFRLVIDRETGKPKGYGFCEYKDEETALSARRNLQGYEINGRQLRVDFAENDKGADRNREQGRGGPGLIAGIDTQRPAVLGDATINQPIGLAVAANAASAISVALNDAHASGISSTRNSFQSQPGVGTDPLTLYLAKMSRNQLSDILSELQVLTKHNQPLARQMLLARPQLSKAVLQAMIMLGMVPPQVLQLPNIRQGPASLIPPSLQDGQPLPSQPIQPPLQTNLQVGVLNRLPDGKPPAAPQNSSVIPPTIHGQSRLQVVSQTQNQVPLQLGQSGGASSLTAQVQPPTGLSAIRPQPPLTTSKPLQQQMQPPLPQQPRPVGYAVQRTVQSTIQNPALLQSLPSQPISNHNAIKPGPSATVIGGQPAGFRDTGSLSVINSNIHSSLVDQTGLTADTSEVLTRPSKLTKLEDGCVSSGAMAGSNISGVALAPASIIGASSFPTNQISNSNIAANAEQQVPQLSPEVESALLQQVMNLTPEQLSSLPPEQRQQVLQLQQMLR
ncbi:cleavage stimulating factor 64 [Nymphaea colorata]|nr:cleavage stimulating factor 64 [Nymphaea colorata]